MTDRVKHDWNQGKRTGQDILNDIKNGMEILKNKKRIPGIPDFLQSRYDAKTDSIIIGKSEYRILEEMGLIKDGKLNYG